MSFVNFFWIFPKGKIHGTIAEFQYKDKTIKLDFDQLGAVNVTEAFGENGYEKFFREDAIRGRTVVDIGAYFGNTPVWFGIMGAKKVVAVEPIASFAGLARKNLALNGLESVCEIMHAAVGGSDSNDIRKDPSFDVVFKGYDALAREFASDCEVPVVSLKTLVDTHAVRDGVLKVDCDGWEYDIFGGADDETLRRFKHIVMEYHYGFEVLEERLRRAGFSVRHTPPIFIHVSERSEKYQKLKVGIVCAEKK